MPRLRGAHAVATGLTRWDFGPDMAANAWSFWPIVRSSSRRGAAPRGNGPLEEISGRHDQGAASKISRFARRVRSHALLSVIDFGGCRRDLSMANDQTIAGGVVHDLPADLKDALTSFPKALATWEAITPLARNEWICWIESAKKSETRAKRIDWGRENLEDGKRRPCCWPGCPHRQRNGAPGG